MAATSRNERNSVTGDMLLDFLAVAGMPADSLVHADSGPMTEPALEAIRALLEGAAEEKTWLEVHPDLADWCGIIDDERLGGVLGIDALDRLPGIDGYPFHKRGPLWYTSDVVINGVIRGPVLFMRDGWIGVNPNDPDTSFMLHSWDNFLQHQWPAIDNDGGEHHGTMLLGDLVLEIGGRGSSPPWAPWSLNFAHVVLSRLLPVVKESVGLPLLKHPPLLPWTEKRVRSMIAHRTDGPT